MGIGVIADIVTIPHHLAQQRRMANCFFTDDEEGGGYFFLFKNFQDLRRPARIRAIIESQGQLAGDIAGSADDERRWQALVDLVLRHARFVIGHDATAGLRRILDMDHFAIAIDLIVAQRGQLVEIRQGRCLIGAESPPDGRVLRTEPPQADARHIGIGDGQELVPGADAIEHPHLVMQPLFVIEEIGIAGRRIELDRRIGFAGDTPGFGDGRRIGLQLAVRLFVPVIAIVTDADDGLVERHAFQSLIQALIEPALGSDRAGRIDHGMLIVDHQEQFVGDRRKRLEVPCVAVDRRSQGQQIASRRKGSTCLSDKSQIIAQGRIRQGFEVEHDTLRLFARHHVEHLADQLQACRRIGQQTRRIGALPLSAGNILHHDQHGRTMLGILQGVGELVVGQINEFIVGTTDIGQAGDDHVEIVDVLLQRHQ